MLARQQGGFTLVELILAMAIFSFGLLIVVSGFLALLGFYQNGVQSRTVQLAARNAMNQVVLAGRGSTWFAYNGTTLCMSSGKIFYLDTVNHRLMQDSGWVISSPCNPTGGGASVTNTDAKVGAFILEQADNYGPGFGTTPCTAGACAPPSNDSHKSMRITIRVTSDPANLNVPVTGTSCRPTAPAFCTITALSTTLTAGAF